MQPSFRHTFHYLIAASCLIFLGPLSAHAADDVLVISQDYNIVEQGKEGPTAKDVRQILYIRKDFVCIDELGGTQGSEKVTESIMLDLEHKLIINLNHLDKRKKIDTFDERRKRIEDKKKVARGDINDLAAGPQRDKVEKMYRALLDDDRNFDLIDKHLPRKDVAGVNCKQVKVHSEKPDYIPFEACLHPEIELPYDNTEVLYLLFIIGKHMADFLHDNKETFKHVPMELHLDLAAGGRLDTKVVSVKQMTADKLDISARGALGNPFEIPADYADAKAKPPKKKDSEDKEKDH
jgi:hypothetical protein